MRIRKIHAIFLAMALAGSAASQAADMKPLYIGTFTADSAESNSSHGAEKVEKNAAALPDALVKELTSRGVVAYRLTDTSPAPQSGLVVSGIFSETIAHGPLSGLSSMGDTAPNTEVKVSIVDAGDQTGKPVASFTTAAQLGGQGSALSFNPIIIGVKFVAHQVASDRSMDDLARRLADQILASRA
jgi:hypothetical protein